jgi:hypothetical protein
MSQSPTPAKRTTKRKPYKVKPDQVLQLMDKGVSIPTIAKVQGVAPSAIYRFLERIGKEKQELDNYKNNMSYSQLQAMAENAELASTIRKHWLGNKEKLLNDNDTGTLKEIVRMAEGGRHYNYIDYRLESDQSTANIASVFTDIEALRNAKPVDK